LENQKTDLRQQSETLDGLRVLKGLIQDILAKNAGFALWKLPHANTLYLLEDGMPQQGKSEVIDVNTARGFLFAPFRSDKPWHFLKADQLTEFTFTQSGDNEKPEIKLELKSEIASSLPKNFKAITAVKGFHISESKPEANTSEQAYKRSVEKALKAIERREIEKLVPARIFTETAPDDFDMIDLYLKASIAYPRAMVSLVSIPNAGTWMGASPELLVSMDKGGIFKTVALAGTQKNVGQSLKQVSWTQKEIEEQALVSRFIINCFKKIRLREFDEQGPKTIISGNLLHLKTEFLVDTVKERYPQLATVMLGLLHPTSAVCGMPKEKAQSLLEELEQFDRQYFTGYLGPVGIEDETHLFVNLRCVQLYGNLLSFYAGAGITEDSDPQKEWDETREKINTIRNLIFKSSPH
jgi:isochorismate synthase